MNSVVISQRPSLPAASIRQIVESYFAPALALREWFQLSARIHEARREVTELHQTLQRVQHLADQATFAAEAAENKAEQTREDLAVMRARLQFIEKTLEISPMDGRARLQLVTMSSAKASGTR